MVPLGIRVRATRVLGLGLGALTPISLRVCIPASTYPRIYPYPSQFLDQCEEDMKAAWEVLKPTLYPKPNHNSYPDVNQGTQMEGVRQ